MIKHNYLKHKETIDNFFWRSLQLFSKQGIIYFVFILCAKLLIPKEFGVYNYVLTAVLFLVMFGDFGMSTATCKYVAEYKIKDKEKLESILFNSGIVIFLLAASISLLTFLFGRFVFKDNYIYAIYLLPLIFFAPMTSLYDGIYRGMKRFRQLAVISVTTGFVSIFLVYFLIKVYGLVGALIAQDLFYFLLFIILAIGYKEFNLKINKEIVREVGKYGFIFGLAVLGNYLFIRFGIILLGHYNYFEQIALYELLNKIFMVLLFPFTLLGQVVAPNFSALSARGEIENIYKKSIKYSVVFAIAGVVLGVIFYFIFPPIFFLAFKNYASLSYFKPLFVFCLLIYMSNVWAATFDSGILVPIGYANLMAKFYLVLGLFGLLLNIILIKIFGYMGIFWGTTLLSLTMAIGLRICFYLKINKSIN